VTPGVSEKGGFLNVTDRVRVLIVDDQPMFVFALRELLREDDRIDVVGSTDNAAHAIELATSGPVDVVLMDLAMPGVDGLEATRRLKDQAPATRVIVVTGHVGLEHEAAATAAGAVAFMRKGALAEQVGDTVVRAAATH
jgi:DNA-binding NarL/FixJ family response regulator